MTRDKQDAREAAATKPPAQRDAAGQYGEAQASPNPSGVSSANPTVLSGDGDATPGKGHGRDRDGSAQANSKSGNREGQSVDDLPVAGTPGGTE
jgi:hypothetical protein